MGVEIERKFLVDHTKWQQQPNKPAAVPYRQGYLVNNPQKTVRVRVAGNKGYITIKGATEGISRKEYEYEIPAREATELLANFAENYIEKTRTRFLFAGKTWEVDEFSGDNKGLIIAEIELPSEDEEVQLPDWITNEVTGDVRYYNAALVKHPYQQW